MPLDDIRLGRDHFVQRMQGNVSVTISEAIRVDRRSDLPNIVVPIAQELSKDVDGHDTETVLCLNLQHGQYGLVQDRVSDVLGCIRVGRNLSKDVVHELTGGMIAFAQHSQEPENLDLQEGVGDARYVVIGTVCSRHLLFERSDEERDGLHAGSKWSSSFREGLRGREIAYIAELVQNRVVQLAHLRDEGDGGELDAVIWVSEQVLDFRDEMVAQVRNLLDDSKGAKGCLKDV